MRLALNSLLIRGFRGFENLEIPRLGRVNLVVGRNSVGKTSILESLRLYWYKANPWILWSLLEDRNEVGRRSRYLSTAAPEFPSVRHLFFGRSVDGSAKGRIEIGPIGEYDRLLKVSIRQYRSYSTDEGGRLLREVEDPSIKEDDPLIPGLRIEVGPEPRAVHRLDRLARSARYSPEMEEEGRSVFMPQEVSGDQTSACSGTA